MATAEHVEALRAQVAPGLFAQFDPDHFPRTSLPALAVAAAAYARDDATGEAVSLALRDALFERGHDISSPEVLVRIADAHGVGQVGPDDEKAVLEERDWGRLRGVKGSPHFFCGDAQAFCPSLDISRDEDGHVRVRRNVEALEGFLADCFAV
jgi:2-hydroxychromene-2-carboxylate isomerase